MAGESNYTGSLAATGASRASSRAWQTYDNKGVGTNTRNAGRVLGLEPEAMIVRGNGGDVIGYSQQAIHALKDYLEKNHLPGQITTGNYAINALVEDVRAQDISFNDFVLNLKHDISQRQLSSERLF